MRQTLTALLCLFIIPLSSCTNEDPDVGLTIQTYSAADLRVGSGDAAKKDDVVAIHYTMKAARFGQAQKIRVDDSHDRGEPWNFLVGCPNVISGISRTVEGMKVGGIRKALIPTSEAYKRWGSGHVILDLNDLDFEVELVSIRPSTTHDRRQLCSSRHMPRDRWFFINEWPATAS